MRKLFGRLNKLEKIIVAFLSLVIIFTGFQIGSAFYEQNTDVTPLPGGVYTEGVVGKMGSINPLFVHWGSVTHDITELIFSGLTRYNPDTKTIVPDLADFTVSADGRQYTFVIKDKAKWHDGTPVTADDVIFTYNTVIKNPAFKGPILTYNDYSGMKITRVDARTVQFNLEHPDSFFLVKTLTGLLPEHLLKTTPPDAMDATPFNESPVGTGPYRLVSITPFPNYSEVSLDANPDYYGNAPHIKTILLRVYPDFDTLQKDLADLDGVRNPDDKTTESILSDTSLVLHRYHLPQTVAVFLNNDSPILKDKKVRLALQLGTDKASLIDAIHEDKIVDTPLLEIDSENWVNQYSIKNANGALFETQWQIPNKEEMLKDKAPAVPVAPATEDTSAVSVISAPNEGKDLETTDNKITLMGKAPAGTQKLFIDDYELKKFTPGDETWSYVASADFGNLKPGKNIFHVLAINQKNEKKPLDAITITLPGKTTDAQEQNKVLSKENEQAPELPIRQNKKGAPLHLRLITSATPENYGLVAKILKTQWLKLGIEVGIEVLPPDEFQSRLQKRDYDLLIFGQNLGYNLDAYPYWHSTQAKSGGLNLSQFKNFVVDSLLEKVRLETKEEDRKKTLGDIQDIMSAEVPAIFLYSPTYSFALSPKIFNASLDNLATTSDRYARIGGWYARIKRTLKPDVGIGTFITWIIKQF